MIAGSKVPGTPIASDSGWGVEALPHASRSEFKLKALVGRTSQTSSTTTTSTTSTTTTTGHGPHLS